MSLPTINDFLEKHCLEPQFLEHGDCSHEQHEHDGIARLDLGLPNSCPVSEFHPPQCLTYLALADR